MLILKEMMNKHDSQRRIAVGISSESRLGSRTLSACIQAKKRKFATPIVVGKNISSRCKLEIVNDDNPEHKIIDMLRDGEVAAVVRGSLEATPVLTYLKQHIPETAIRIALFEDKVGHSFLLAPVGIDEGNSYIEKECILREGINLLKFFNITPKVCILAGGKQRDVGRNPISDQTIADAEKLIEKYPDYEIFTPGIMLEKGLKKNANFILAPGGISGNLIYRSLVHVSGFAVSYGAPFRETSSDKNCLCFTDTSTVGTIPDYVRAIAFTSSLAC
ncbi:MAG: methanogenesis marker protein Mmp4/MtxX [Candidatus Hodarchaeales archaeon]|jgi:predicted methyltransferase MtxX (methanogen marker protein 4)